MIPLKEDQYTEFKTSFSDEVIVSLAAFANAKGGKVYVGVRDDGVPAGVALGAESTAKWINEIKQKTEPSIIPDVEVMEEAGKQVVVLSVQEYPVKPVAMKGRYYRRQQNSNHVLSVDEIANLHLQTRNSSWDFYADPKHTVSDLDMDLVQQVIDRMNRRGMRIYDSPEVFLRKKELCAENGQVTYGAYLLFKKREDILTTVELGHFQDKNGILIKDSLRSKSNIVTQVEDVMSFVKKHINMAVIISPDRVENIQRWDYPLEAIREIVLNMIIHRDYRSPADSVVKILPDRMEFFNPGDLPDGLTVEKLMSNDYSSRPRNKQIADIFKEMGDIEKYGSGIRRVCTTFTKSGFAQPEWKATSGGIMVTVFLDMAKEMKFDLPENPYDNPENPYDNPENPYDNPENPYDNPENPYENLISLDSAILDAIRKNPRITQGKLSELTGKHKDTIYTHIKKLQEQGLITRIGPAKGGHWEVKGK